LKANLVNKANETNHPINYLGDNTMKRYILASLSVLALSAYATPGFALTERFDEARRENLDKGISTEVSLTERFDEARRENLDKGISTEVSLTERFDEARRENLDKGISAEVSLTERFDEARRENLDK
jgi:hypothetical protein